jgi:hypothetical protein
MSSLREDEKRQFVRYYTSQGTEAEFLNSNFDQGGKNQFSRLRNRLQWDEVKGTSIINEDN